MRVLHLTSSLASEDGGPAVMAREFASRQATRGHDVRLAAPDGRHADPSLSVDPRVHGTEVRLARRWAPGGYGFAPALWRELSRAPGPDVVHLHGVFSLATHVARAFADRGVPVIVRSCGMLEDESLALGRGWAKRAHLSLCERPLLEAAAAIHVTSEAERDHLAELRWRDKAVVIPHGVDVPRSAPSRRHDGRRLLYLSRLHEKKRPHWVLEAAACLPTLEVVLAGTGDPAYVRELKERARALGVADRVRFAGHLGRAAYQRELDAASALVLPSITENFAVVVAEAWGRGCPTLTTPGVALSGPAGRAGAGWVSPDDLDGFIETVQDFLDTNVREREQRSRAARELARQYSWDHCLDQVDALYARATAQRTAA